MAKDKKSKTISPKRAAVADAKDTAKQERKAAEAADA